MHFLQLLHAKRQQEVVTVLIEQIEDARSQGPMASLSSMPPGPFEAPAMLGKGRGWEWLRDLALLCPHTLLFGWGCICCADGCPVMRPVSWMLLPLASLAPYQPCLGGFALCPLYEAGWAEVLRRVFGRSHLYFQLWFSPGILVQ